MTTTAAGKIIRVWDLPTRLFHWLLAASIAAAWLTGETGGTWLIWHGRLGFLIVGLVAFRLVWGFVGSTYARFTAFFPTPAKIKAYLAGAWNGIGHNPLGALSVFGLLALVVFQIATGLCAYNDDIGFEGPFHPLVGAAAGKTATWLHHKAFKVLMILAGLHVAAIAFYARVKKDNLLVPMLTGDKAVVQGESARGGGTAAFLVALVIALAVVYGASGAWIAQPPPPPPAAAPAW
ncbi:MAG TPA: cytochrome b/b6 domain-containing protein [Rhodocyclaceae bacterium]|nr:cytochrome b/b6 domain-containing protein [Rhodocyclaceae bacterium]